MAFTLSGDAATTRTNLGLGDAATKTTGTAAGNIPVLDGSGQIASGVLSNAAVADNAITLAKMAGGTDGNLITYDASGDPAYVTTGTSGQVLTSGGVGVAPTFQTSTHTPDDNSVTLAKMAGGTDGNLITYDASGDPAYVTTGTSGQVLTSGGVGVAPTFQTAAGGATDIDGLSDGTTSGTNNTGLGSTALDSLTSGGDNTAIGSESGTGVTTGYSNTFVGYRAGAQTTLTTTGLSNTVIGAQARCSSASSYYEIVLGANVNGIGTQYFTFGQDTASNRVYNQFTSNASWTRASDERIKKDIQDSDCGLDFINDLRPVTYKFKAPSELDLSMSEYDVAKNEAAYKDKMYGFIAQEVKTAMDNNNITDFAGWHQIDDGQDNMQGISYEMFVMPLVKAVQELTTKVTALEAEVTALKDANPKP